MLSLIAFACSGKEKLVTLVEGIHKALEKYHYELIIVDDNGSDGMAEVVERLSHQYPVKLICSEVGKDSALAVITGFEQARGEILGVMDVNLGNSPEKIPELLQAIDDGADVAVASRYMPGGGIGYWSAKEKVISRVTTMLARLVLPSIRKVRDPMSGLFLLKRTVIEGVVLKPGHRILFQVLARGRSGEVTEVPYIEERAYGEGNVSLREQLGYVESIFLLATRERELRRIVQFCLVGLSGVGVNMGSFWLLTRYAGLSEPYDLIALILSIELATLSNFVLNDIWTFKDRRIGNIKSTLLRALKFNIISVGYFIIYYAIYTPLTRFTGIYDLVVMLIAIGIGFIWNFSMNLLWTWRKSEVDVLIDT